MSLCGARRRPGIEALTFEGHLPGFDTGGRAFRNAPEVCGS